MEIESQSQIIHPASLLNDLELTATLPHEMVTAQHQLIQWCINKLVIEKADSLELQEATEHAKINKWKHSTLQKQYYASLKRIMYYEKVLAALQEGYYIIPNFPVTMFAIRTKKTTPDAKFEYRYWGDKEQQAQELTIGEGEYKNPFPLVMREKAKNSDAQDSSYADEWDGFEFPITMAKPEIMHAVSRSLALKIFDQFGIMPAEKKTDPVIIGQIIRKNSYQKKVVSFMIAWHLNTNTI